MILEDPDKVRLALRRRAMDLLARREHSRHELGNKLSAAIRRSQQRLESQDLQENSEDQQQSAQQNAQMLGGLIAEVLDKLERDKLLSDSRFTESYVNGRINKGYGPLHIRHQLRQKQIDSALLDNNLEQLDQLQWIDQLSALIKRRVGDTGLPERGSKEYLKLQRFILSRGFTSSQWYEVEKRFKSP